MAGSVAARAAALTTVALLLAGCPTTAVRRAPPVPPAHPEPELVGRTHVVQPGETLWRISRTYGVSVDELVLVNGISDATQLEAGRRLFIPGAAEASAPPGPVVEPEPAVTPKPREQPPSNAPLDWPLIGVLSAQFGVRGEAQHDGIDISAPEGTAVRAAADGEVLFSGEQRGYGNIIIVQHANGLLTLYAQNKENLVREGVRVKKGDVIARVGEFSRTSGPHLHFEVREGSVPKDPLKYLPPPR
ncbi:MAG: peptidoglycan DD-metalloendopeptidase family protein [Myxococcales bacterium]